MKFAHQRVAFVRSRRVVSATVIAAMLQALTLACRRARGRFRSPRRRRRLGQDGALSRHLGRAAHLRADRRGRALRHGLGAGRGPPRAAPRDLRWDRRVREAWWGSRASQVDLRSRMWDHYGAAKSRSEKLRPSCASTSRRSPPASTTTTRRIRRTCRRGGATARSTRTWCWRSDGCSSTTGRSTRPTTISTRRHRAERTSPALAARTSSRSRPRAPPRWRAILAIDPHLSWYGPSRFWEFRIHAGELEGSGFAPAGLALFGQRAQPDARVGDDDRRSRHRRRLRAHARSAATPSGTATTASGAISTSRDVIIAFRRAAAAATARSGSRTTARSWRAAAARPTRRRSRTPTSRHARGDVRAQYRHGDYQGAVRALASSRSFRRT